MTYGLAQIVHLVRTMSSSKCTICGVRKRGSTDFCRTHRFAVRRGMRRMNEDNLIVDVAGGGWWAWTLRGEVVVIGQNSRVEVLAELGRREQPENLGEEA